MKRFFPVITLVIISLVVIGCSTIKGSVSKQSTTYFIPKNEVEKERESVYNVKGWVCPEKGSLPSEYTFSTFFNGEYDASLYPPYYPHMKTLPKTARVLWSDYPSYFKNGLRLKLHEESYEKVVLYRHKPDRDKPIQWYNPHDIWSNCTLPLKNNTWTTCGVSTKLRVNAVIRNYKGQSGLNCFDISFRLRPPEK